jgi:Domain of unknown function (DUF3783)
MEQGEFRKVERSEERMYGPFKLLVCGYSQEEQNTFLAFLEEIGFGTLPVIFVTDADIPFTLSAILDREDRAGMEEPSLTKRAVILSGFTQAGLHQLISASKQAGFPAQLWATLTPVSEKWAIGYLLEELAKEAEAMKRQQKSPG